MTYAYDQVRNLTEVSNPPSEGQSVRNDTTYTHFDNGWVKTSTDPWDIVTTYTYDDRGQQTGRTLTSAGGSSSRTMTWDYYPDGKLKSRSDDGVPVGNQVVLVDNSDVQNTETTGVWDTTTTGQGFYGYDYHTHPAGGSDTFTWNLTIPQDGSYEVFVRSPQATATAADYTITHSAGSTARQVDQTTNPGEWVSLGSYSFTAATGQEITLTSGTSGAVAADAVKLVRDNTGDTDTEKKDFGYGYDPNANLTTITDTTPGARVDTYAMTYDGLNRVAKVEEKKNTTVVNTTDYTYDPNSNPLTVDHDDQYSAYEYDTRDLASKVTNGKDVSDPDPKVTTFTYTPRGQEARRVKDNGNTVDSTYTLDGLLAHQVEKQTDGTVVNEHTLTYNANGHRVEDTAKTMSADASRGYLDRVNTYRYDPRDRLYTVTKADLSGTVLETETYRHDANNNVVSQTVDAATTTYTYDRNRLVKSTTGTSTAAYNYDHYGRLNTITADGTVVASYTYDGFDRTTEQLTTDQTGTHTTAYSYDALDRTTTRTTKTGTPDAETIAYNYLGTSSEVLNEEVAGVVQDSYQYTPWGERLSQTKTTDGTEHTNFYSYNPHSDVEALTDSNGNTKATYGYTAYGYTAYGKNDLELFTGVDKPHPQDPTLEPENPYRFNAKRYDVATTAYDMGFRDYTPGLNRFTSRDTYNGALADLNLSTDPWNSNRYAFAGGNPITGIENDGHKIVQCSTECTDPTINDGYWAPSVEAGADGEIYGPDKDYSWRARAKWNDDQEDARQLRYEQYVKELEEQEAANRSFLENLVHDYREYQGAVDEWLTDDPLAQDIKEYGCAIPHKYVEGTCAVVWTGAYVRQGRYIEAGEEVVGAAVGHGAGKFDPAQRYLDRVAPGQRRKNGYMTPESFVFGYGTAMQQLGSRRGGLNKAASTSPMRLTGNMVQTSSDTVPEADRATDSGPLHGSSRPRAALNAPPRIYGTANQYLAGCSGWRMIQGSRSTVTGCEQLSRSSGGTGNSCLSETRRPRR